jgi:hypothetical protein
MEGQLMSAESPDLTSAELTSAKTTFEKLRNRLLPGVNRDDHADYATATAALNLLDRKLAPARPAAGADAPTPARSAADPAPADRDAADPPVFIVRLPCPSL